MIPQAAIWIWFGVAWLFILAVLFKRWHAREKADQAATEERLERTKAHVGDEYWWDGV